MTQEEKQLLLKDLSSRLPYGVRVFVSGDDFDNYQYPYLLTAISKFGQDIFCKIYSPIYTPLGCPGVENVKPYLFPLSSITEEQTKELIKLINTGQNDNNEFMRTLCRIEFYHKHHFDYRGLIHRGLAIDATGLNIY